MNITVFGAGYVGLVQAAILSEVGNNVVCVDIDQTRVNELALGIIPIHEPGLSEIILDSVKNKMLSFTTDAKFGINHADLIFIAVGTPQDQDGSADLKFVDSVAKTIGSNINKEKIIVTKSTVPVGTSRKVLKTLIESNANSDTPISKELIHVASNPEFLREGCAVEDCRNPERVIIGSRSDFAIKTLKALYSPFNTNDCNIIVMDPESSELTKYGANCFLATKISFMNELSNIAEAVGADIESVRMGMGSDSRIGYKFTSPGCGYGGSCFPKDVKALIRTFNENDVEPSILSSVDHVNQGQKTKLYRFLSGFYDGELSGKTIAVWGLAFKPNTDDVRDAPSLTLVRSLLESGAKVRAFDPKAAKSFSVALGHNEGITYCENHYDALKGANALAICTEWDLFKSPDFKFLASEIKDRLIVDGRNMYTPKCMENAAIHYYGIGRGASLNKNFE